LDREARREAHQQRQQRKRAFRAHFNVHEHEGGYQVDGEVPGFEQENFEIEVTDEHTLRVAGNTDKKAEPQPQPTESTAEVQAVDAEAHEEKMDGVTLNEPEQEIVSPDAGTPSISDTESHKSYQATVEDDFEDLGAETSSTLSAGSDESEPKEPKGKEKVVEEPSIPNTETVLQHQAQPEAPAQSQQPVNDEWRFQGTFERTFRFPERIDAANVRASLRNGLLSVTVPKAKAPEARRILIQ